MTKVVKDRGFVEIGEAGHVFDLFELWRIHLFSDVHVDLFLLIMKTDKPH